MPQLPWTEDMVTTLLNIVILKKAHLSGGCKGVKEIWNDVNNAFFAQSFMDQYRAAHYKADNHRKIRDKFENILNEVQKDIETGNQSGKDGELSEKYLLVQQIKEEIDDQDAEKATNGELKRKLDANADEILKRAKVLKPVEGFGRRKSLDGSTSDSKGSDSSNSKNTMTSFDEKLLSFLEKDKSTATCPEEDVEKTMAEWIERRGKSELDLLSEGKMPVELFPTLDYIGMDVILNIYCSRSLNFSPIYFKEQLTLLNIGVLETHKIYKVFDKWRIQACDAFKITNSHKDIYVTPTNEDHHA